MIDSDLLCHLICLHLDIRKLYANSCSLCYCSIVKKKILSSGNFGQHTYTKATGEDCSIETRTRRLVNMGGHAFRNLHCPRISGGVYAKVKQHTTEALQSIFLHVTIPTEMPEKADYGDIDFLVAGLLHSPTSTTMDNFNWSGTVDAIKSVLNTTHGRRGHLNPGCMYFAIRAPGHEEEFWVQVDVKVCFKPELFEWQKFELNYASNSKMIGSMVKPLGLTIDPEGLHIRVEEVEETNFSGSMLWVSQDPRDVLRITGLDRRILDAGFNTKNESECN
jgi:hypothetical protein